MEFRIIGDRTSPVAILLHDAGLNHHQYAATAKMLARRYCVVLPDLTGHGDARGPFVSIEEEADALMQFIRREFKGKVELIGGSGLGGMVALETASRMPFSNLNLFLDGVSFQEPARPLIPSAFLKFRYRALYRNPRIREQVGQIPPFRELEPVFRAMSAWQPPELLSRKARMRIVHGSLEGKGVRQTGQLLLKHLRNSTLEVQEGMNHGDLVLENPGKLSIMLFSQLNSLF